MLVKSNLLTLELLYLVGLYFVSIDARGPGSQWPLFSSAYGPWCGHCKLLGQVLYLG